jgi:hypothetical protein
VNTPESGKCKSQGKYQSLETINPPVYSLIRRGAPLLVLLLLLLLLLWTGVSVRVSAETVDPDFDLPARRNRRIQHLLVHVLSVLTIPVLPHAVATGCHRTVMLLVGEFVVREPCERTGQSLEADDQNTVTGGNGLSSQTRTGGTAVADRCR